MYRTGAWCDINLLRFFKVRARSFFTSDGGAWHGYGFDHGITAPIMRLEGGRAQAWHVRRRKDFAEI